MRSAADQAAAARSRSAGIPPAGPGRGRSSPGVWRTVTGPSSSARPARAWTSAPEPGNRRPGPRPKPPPSSWLDHAAAYAAMKWPLAAARTRAGIADALATITPALLTPGRGRPPAAVLRAALYGHAFNPARAGTDPGPPAAAALGWASASLPAADRPGRPGRDPARAGGPGPAPGWDPGRGHDHHPQACRLPRLPRLRGRTRTAWKPTPWTASPGGPRDHPCSAGPRSAATPAEVQAILAEVTQNPPGADRVLRLPVLRGAAPRRSRRAACQLLHPPRTRLGTADPHGIPPPVGAGLDRQRHPTRAPRPQTPPRKAPSGRSRSPRSSSGLLRWHLQTFGCAADGRLFQGARGGPLSESLYGRISSTSRTSQAMPEDGTGTEQVLAPMTFWIIPGTLEALIPGRMQGHGGTEEVSR